MLNSSISQLVVPRDPLIVPANYDTVFDLQPLWNRGETATGESAVLNGAVQRERAITTDGVNDYVEIAQTDLADPGPGVDFCITLVLKPLSTGIGLGQIIGIGDTSTNDLAWGILRNTNKTLLTATSADGTASTIISGGTVLETMKLGIVNWFKVGTTQQWWINGEFSTSGAADADLFDSTMSLQLARNSAGSRHMDLEIYWALMQKGDFSDIRGRWQYVQHFQQQPIRPDITIP